MQGILPSPIPLTAGDDDVFRVTGTRVTLDTIVAAFDAGATPEEIVQQYPSVGLPDVYAVIAYVLANRAQVDQYLAKRASAAEQVRSALEARFPAKGIRDRLLARRRSTGARRL